MARERVANLTQLVSKASSLKIIGWSVKYSQESLLECLASLGQIQSFLHYPQLNTTYVKMQFTCTRTLLVQAVLAERFPRARVELHSTCDILESESKLENPDVTAFVSRKTLFTETAIYKDLKHFGGLRALNFGYTQKHHKWYCKASFYESCSLDSVLNQKQSSKRIISQGIHCTLERYQVAYLHSVPEHAGRFRPRREALRTLGQGAGENQQNSTDATLTRFCRIESAAYAQKNQSRRARTSQSCSRVQQECLPTYSTFRNSNTYIENALKIHKSRRQELSTLGPRSKSLDKSPRVQVQIQIGTVVPKTSSSRKLVVNTFTFDENELLFIEIGKNHRFISNLYVPISSIEQQRQRGGIIEDQQSYLSLDDLSDGYSATEEGQEMQIIKEETFKVFSTRDSGKETSQIYMTKYSSDAEQSLPKSPSDSRFDCIFGSNSALNCGKIPYVGAGRPTIADCRQPAQLQYFTFPSY